MRICLIGSNHPSFNPRLVREADSLTNNGHQVRVIAPWFNPDLAERDLRLLASRKWELKVVDYLPNHSATKLRSLILRSRRKLSFAVSNYVNWPWLMRYAYIAALPELTELACRWSADWYIAHTQGVLPAAAEAADRWNANLGFDCEDLLSELGTDPVSIVTSIEERYLDRCTYISVPTNAVADFLRKKYNLKNLLILYNVFSLKTVSGLAEPGKRPMSEQMRLHWFSQTIGPNRGIEDIIEAIAQVQGVELHLRGRLPIQYRSWFDQLLNRYLVTKRVTIHGIVDPDQLNTTLGSFDVGLALERATNVNYNLAATNKLFAYLLAGLAICATSTIGQREIFDKLPEVGYLYAPGDIQGLIRSLQLLKEDRFTLINTQTNAWQAAREQFCWEIEQGKFLREILKI